ncbi:helix-turn-helix domain-containing protein [Proteiniphilum sp. UBA5480]|jgi:signal transduction histidine kinase/AraC-like DNA-binding protein|uniref:helix-turn-helix domain-containing protein n=1 Tax=Proteiniphilum sp. UBA5480 TaxID=1947282 RepID=UPI00257CB201|nr:helix-turn-helix domain-containing protein [Proteiniphilum sp. UBA5480]
MMVSFAFLACNQGINGDMELTRNNLNREKNQNVIDSLVSRISKDTVALTSYLKLSQSIGDQYAEMKTYKQLGVYYFNNYNFLKATQYHEQYLDVAKKGHYSISELEALNMLAYNYFKIDDLNESSAHYYEALALLNKLQNNDNEKIKQEKAKTLNGLGNIYLKMNQPDEAMAFLQEAHQIDKKNNNIIGEAENLASIGSAYENKLDYDSAFYFFDLSLSYYIKANSLSGMNYCFERIGNIYMLKGDYESATVYFESAYNSLYWSTDRLNWLNTCFSLGSLNIKKGNYHEAETIILEGLTVSKELNLTNGLEKAYSLLSELYIKQGNTVAALETYNLSDSLANVFRNKRNIIRIMTNRLNYENGLNEEKLIVLALQLEKLERNKQKTIYIILLSAVVLFSFALLYFQYIKHRKRKVESSLQQERLKSNFYINFSHEFKTPVTIIAGLIERIRNNLEQNNLHNGLNDLDILSRQSKDLLTLIDEMSSTASILEIVKSSKTVNGNIIGYLNYLCENFSAFAKSKKIDYNFRSNTGELVMDYQPEFLRLIINNLVNSAFNYCHENDRIAVQVSCNRDEKTCAITVSHNGKSIQKEDLTNIFELSHRISGNETKNNGNGAGLPFTKIFIEKFNGSIDVRSEPLKDTTFRVILPIINERCGSNGHSDNNNNELKNDEATNFPYLLKRQATIENPTVLIVDGNKNMSYYLSSVLGDNYHILTDDNSESAIQTANEIIPDIIIADTKMYHMNGFDFCKAIKDSNVTAHIPVILLSAFHSKEERIRGFKCGADVFLSKPVYEDELLAVLEQVLNARKQIRDKYAIMITHTGSKREYATVKNDPSVAFLKQITDLIYKEASNTENIIEKIAAEACLSSSQLNRKIKAITGMTTSNYILKIKLNKAGKMLAQSQKPIGEIALSCGFSDFAYFSRSFKKEFGMTPTSFQRMPRLSS